MPLSYGLIVALFFASWGNLAFTAASPRKAINYAWNFVRITIKNLIKNLAPRWDPKSASACAYP